MTRENDKNLYNFASETWVFLDSILYYFVSDLILEI